MGRGDLANGQWARLETLLPRGIKSGRPPVWTRRQLIDGIRWRTRTGAPWSVQRIRVEEIEVTHHDADPPAAATRSITSQRRKQLRRPSGQAPGRVHSVPICSERGVPAPAVPPRRRASETVSPISA
ncbi:transposase [Streptomyces sp. NPDC059002]|uniref:transposase n=1 Tax=Streptomyces sp. NPDC059002 TaxID=3346690 RepID=UPI0036CAB13C